MFLTEIFSACVDVVAMRRVRGRGRLAVRRGRVQRGALVAADRRQPRHERRIVLERRTHHSTAGDNNTSQLVRSPLMGYVTLYNRRFLWFPSCITSGI